MGETAFSVHTLRIKRLPGLRREGPDKKDGPRPQAGGRPHKSKVATSYLPSPIRSISALVSGLWPRKRT